MLHIAMSPGNCYSMDEFSHDSGRLIITSIQFTNLIHLSILMKYSILICTVVVQVSISSPISISVSSHSVGLHHDPEAVPALANIPAAVEARATGDAWLQVEMLVYDT